MTRSVAPQASPARPTAASCQSQSAAACTRKATNDEDAGHQRVPAGPPARYERGTERGEQQAKPEWAEFGERLEVQLVGICRIDGDGRSRNHCAV